MNSEYASGITEASISVNSWKYFTFILLHIYLYHLLYSDGIKCKTKLIARCETCLNSITKTP